MSMKEKLAAKGIAVGIIILILIACWAFSWIATCGIIKLVTLCFGWTFKWSIATGIWLIMMLAKTIFNVTVNNKN